MPIPATIHFIFGMDERFGGKPFSYIHYLAVRTAKAVNKANEIVLHYAFEPQGEWWEASKNHITLHKVTPPSSIFGRELRHYAHRADVLRLEILRSEGGIYLDMDVISVRPLDPFLSRSLVMGIQPNIGLCNAVILAEPRAPFLDLWIESYRDFDGALWDRHSVKMPYQIAQAHPHLIDKLDEHAFFFPMYNDPMRNLLWRSSMELRTRLSGVRSDVRFVLGQANLDGSSGRLPYRNHIYWTTGRYYRQLRQSFCLHLWESLWWEPYLHDLSPIKLSSSHGLFQKLIAEILPDEVTSE